ncbi:MAG TPA: EAL domain-containing protein [Rhodocyclaceae bacterium]
MIEAPSRSRRRLEILVATIMVPAILLLTVQHWLNSRSQILRSTEAQATLIGASASAALAFNDSQAGEEVAASAQQLPQAELIALYRSNGQLLAYRSSSEAPPHKIEPVRKAAASFTLHALELDQPVMLESEVVGSIRLRIGLASFYNELGRFVGGLVLIILIIASLYAVASRRAVKRMAEAEDALRHMALHDRITGLANRHAFELALEQTRSRHGRDGGGSTLLFVDVDGFKKVNDLFGHHVGDEVLHRIGQRLTDCLRSSDILARLGGDEFGVILVDVDNPDYAARIVEQMVAAMATPFVAASHTAHLGVSVGVAAVPRDGASSDELLAHADMAMYQAKNGGKNTYRFFSENIGNAVRARLDLELELRAAIQADQLYVDYQPQVEADGAIRGMEALVRWRHPQRGLVSPADFIPVAEDSDLILEVGDWVLRRVCRDIRMLRERGLAVPPVAINVSARQFARKGLVERVRAQLTEHGLGSEQLEIELTESVVMGHADGADDILNALRDSGLRLAVDDFGTGYSSLAYLKRLPVDKLKIDRSFVMHLPANPEDRAIVAAIIGIAKALELRVVAEGVETVAQAELLRAYGCHLIQGYLTGRPTTIEHLAAQLPRAG